jgi:outer membrane protein assembly factor BamB
LLITLDDAKLLALAPDGAERYTYDPQAGWNVRMTAPAVTDQLGAVIGLSNGKVVQIDGWGETEWTYETKSPFQLRPVLDRHSLVYCTSTDGTIYCLAPRGSLEWRCQISGSCTKSAPVLGSKAGVYQVTDTGAVALVWGGKLEWQKEFQLWPAAQAVSGEGNLYGIDSAGRLTAISAKGEELWRKNLGHRAVGAPCCGPGVVYVGNKDCELYAVSAAGEVQWMSQLGGEPIGIRRNYKDGRLYVWAQNGQFYALDSAGKFLYAYPGSAAAKGLALGSGNMVYFISSGEVAALQD